jgi:hypothetical protein
VAALILKITEIIEHYLAVVRHKLLGHRVAGKNSDFKISEIVILLLRKQCLQIRVMLMLYAQQI